ncbi:MAG: molecular chaperone DnaJ, partial [Bacteroidales bacterium]|nr:molecular chaperone DnaJ [Bacteroidales bacterium]
MGNFTKWIAGGLGWAFFGPLGGLLGFLIGSAFEKDGTPVFQGAPGKTTPGDFAMSL